MQSLQSNSLKTVDDVLKDIIRHRMPFFNNVSQYYSAYTSTNRIGFESLIVSESFKILQTKFCTNSVFVEFPCNSNEKIDLHVYYPTTNHSNSIQKIFAELKMYYSNSKNQYDKDFSKLKRMVDLDPECIAVQIHFQYYSNRNKPAHGYLRQYYQTLHTTNNTYWRSIGRIGPSGGQHFYRLAFGRN